MVSKFTTSDFTIFRLLLQDEENEWMTFYKYKYVLSLLQPVPKEYDDLFNSLNLSPPQ